MGWTIPPEPPPVLLHYSEDPNIAEFVPHTPVSNPTQAPAVWTIDPAHAPLYWFPRDCPRIAVWANDPDQQERLDRCFVTRASRVQAVPLSWFAAIRDCRLFEYRFDPAPFAAWLDAEGQWIAHERVGAMSVEPVGDLFDRHVSAGVELRFVPDLEPLRTAVLGSALPFSIVRVRS